MLFSPDNIRRFHQMTTLRHHNRECIRCLRRRKLFRVTIPTVPPARERSFACFSSRFVQLLIVANGAFLFLLVLSCQFASKQTNKPVTAYRNASTKEALMVLRSIAESVGSHETILFFLETVLQPSGKGKHRCSSGTSSILPLAGGSDQMHQALSIFH